MLLQRSRLLRVLVAIGLVALAAAGLRLSEPEEADFEVARGVLGEPVAIDGGNALADDVRVGTALSRDDEVYATTPGLFLVVRVEVSATGRDRIAGYQAELLTAERRYAALGGSVLGAVEPGFATAQDLVFEVDPAALDDLTLELDHREFIRAYPERVRIHLGITGANADDWRDASRDQVLTPLDQTTWGR
jgi:hypothetical protein